MSQDHKPESIAERERIKELEVGYLHQEGVMHTVWNKIPFLNIAHSLRDLWSYSPKYESYYVFPIPDVTEYISDRRDQFLMLASDGLWKVVSPQEVVNFI